MDLLDQRPSECPLCGLESYWIFDKAGYAIQQCCACGHRFVSIPPRCTKAHIATTYGNRYFEDDPGGVPNYLTEQRLIQQRGREYGEIVLRCMPAGRMLDVGAAAGFLLAGFIERGWQGEGIEPNARMARHAREQLGLTVHTCSLEDYTGTGEFDLVTAIQVVAHFVDPAAALLRMRELLVPQGLLLIETWDAHSHAARWLGRHWHEINPPSVLHFFSRAGLQHYLERQGFELVARGRPWRRISGRHMRTILTRMVLPLPGGRLWKQICRLIPSGLVFPYPPEDLFWMLLRKTGT